MRHAGKKVYPVPFEELFLKNMNRIENNPYTVYRAVKIPINSAVHNFVKIFVRVSCWETIVGYGEHDKIQG